MRTMIADRRGIRILMTVLVALALGLLSAMGAILSAAQDKPPPGAKKDEQSKKPKPPVRDEQEETKTPSIKKPIKVDDEDVDVRRPKPAKLGVTQPADLEPEAQNAKHPAVKELFHGLAIPRDEVHLQIGQTIRVDPIPERIGPQTDPEHKVHLQGYDDKGKALKPQDLPFKSIVSISPYEETALKQ